MHFTKNQQVSKSQQCGKTSSMHAEGSASSIRQFDFSDGVSSYVNDDDDNESCIETMLLLPSISTTTLYRNDEEADKRKSKKFDITLTESELNLNCDDTIS